MSQVINFIKLDFNRSNNVTIPTIEWDQGSRFVRVQLQNNNQSVDVTGSQVVITVIRNDLEEIIESCNILNAKDGLIEFEISKSMVARQGDMLCQLKLSDNDSLLSSQLFKVSVNNTLMVSLEESRSDMDVLIHALGEVQDIDNRFNKTNYKIDENYQKVNAQLYKIDENYQKVNAQLSDVKHGVSVNRQFVNVLSLGVKNDASVDCTSIIHEAKKEYALFFPRGQYLIEYIELSSNDIIIGESESNTFLIPNHSSKKAFIYLEEGPVNKVKFENFTINKSPNNRQIGINLEANFPKTGYQHGGLWDSTIRNIYLTNAVPEHSWDGIGMKIVGSGDNALLPVQANIFERVNIFVNNVANCDNIPLIVEGQVEQNLFSRCSFSGIDVNKNLSSLENVSGLFRRRRNEDGSVDGDQGGGTNTFIQCYFGNTPTCLKFERSYNPTFINCYYENARRFVRIETVAKATIIGGAFLNVGGTDNIIESDYSQCELYLTDSTLKGNVKCRGLNCSSKLLTNSMYDEVSTTNEIIEFVGEYSIVHCNHSNSSPIIDTLKPSDILNNHKEFYFNLVQKNGKTIKFTKNTGNIFNDLTIDISSSSPVIKATFIPYCNKYKIEVL